jgi:hypothetical protein
VSLEQRIDAHPVSGTGPAQCDLVSVGPAPIPEPHHIHDENGSVYRLIALWRINSADTTSQRVPLQLKPIISALGNALVR